MRDERLLPVDKRHRLLEGLLPEGRG